MSWNNLKKIKDFRQNKKFIKWLTWLEDVFRRRGVLIDTDSCAYGKTHLVSKAEKIGGGWMFYSKSCSGCPISRREAQLFKETKKVSPTAPNCALLKSPLFSQTEVKNGQEVELSFIQENKKPAMVTAVPYASRKKKNRDGIVLHASGGGGSGDTHAGGSGGGQVGGSNIYKNVVGKMKAPPKRYAFVAEAPPNPPLAKPPAGEPMSAAEFEKRIMVQKAKYAHLYGDITKDIKWGQVE